MWSTRQTYPAQQKIPARPNTHTSLPHHKTLPPLLPPAAASLPLLPPPSPSPSSPLRRHHRHPSLLYGPSRRPVSTGGAALGSHSGAGRERRWRHSPARAGAATVSQPREDGAADGGASLRRREGRQRRIPARARAAPAAHRDFRVNICSSRFQCGFMKLFEAFCC